MDGPGMLLRAFVLHPQLQTESASEVISTVRTVFLTVSPTDVCNYGSGIQKPSHAEPLQVTTNVPTGTTGMVRPACQSPCQTNASQTGSGTLTQGHAKITQESSVSAATSMVEHAFHSQIQDSVNMAGIGFMPPTLARKTLTSDVREENITMVKNV